MSRALHVVPFRVFTPARLPTKTLLSSWRRVEITLGGCRQSEGFSRIYSTVGTGSVLAQHCLSWTFSGGGSGQRLMVKDRGTPPPPPCPSLRLYPPVSRGEQQFNQPDTLPNTSLEQVCRQRKHLMSLQRFFVIYYRQRRRFRAFAFVVHMICG